MSSLDWLREDGDGFAIEKIDRWEAAGPEERARLDRQRRELARSYAPPVEQDAPIGLCPECLGVLPDDGVCDDPECPDAS